MLYSTSLRPSDPPQLQLRSTHLPTFVYSTQCHARSHVANIQPCQQKPILSQHDRLATPKNEHVKKERSRGWNCEQRGSRGRRHRTTKPAQVQGQGRPHRCIMLWSRVSLWMDEIGRESVRAQNHEISTPRRRHLHDGWTPPGLYW